MSYASNIRRARRAAGLTQKQLADAIGCAPGTIQQYERGVREPKSARLKEIADACGVSVNNLGILIEEMTTVDDQLLMFKNLASGDLIYDVKLGEDTSKDKLFILWPDGDRTVLTLKQMSDLLDEAEDYFRIRLKRIKDEQRRQRNK